MTSHSNEEIRAQLVGILEPDLNIPTCLKLVSLPDEWVPGKDYFVRRNEILGILSYGITKKNKIHKVNFWNLSVNYYVSENARVEKIPDPLIQKEILFLENTLIDFLINISNGTNGWDVGNGIIKILRNHCFYSLFYREKSLVYSGKTENRSHLEIEIRTVMDIIVKKRQPNIVELNSEMRDFIAQEIPVLPKNVSNKHQTRLPDLKESMLDFLIDSGLEISKATGREREILEEANYGLQNAFQSIETRKNEIQFLTEDNWDLIFRNHKIFLETLPETANLKWERVGYSNETEVQYLTKKYPNHSLQGKLVRYKLKEFFLDTLSLRVMNISYSLIFDSKFRTVDFSNSISVFSKWKNDTLEECIFSHIDFSDSEMVDCKFRNCVFLGGDFESVTFEDCIFDSCDFSNAKFKKAIFYKCRFQNSNFKNARFVEAILYLSDFQNSDIRKAINKNSEFNECNFY